MENLQEATAHICDLKGSIIALHTFMAALLRSLPPDALPPLQAEYDKQVEAMRTELLNARVSEQTIAAFERDVLGPSTTIQARLNLLQL